MKKSVRFLLPLLAAVLIVLFLLWQNGVFSTAPQGEAVGEIHLSIRCDRALASQALSPELRDYLPENGVLGETDSLPLLEDDTAYSVLSRFCREQKIALESTGSVYVEGIGGLYELDCGAASGWMFCVNGEFFSQSADSVTLQDGDKVEWVYTCDLGQDVGGGNAA